MKLKIHNIHYGLTLLYSYLLPVIDVVETTEGFKFQFTRGVFNGIECFFNENNLETECVISDSMSRVMIQNILGLSKHDLFIKLCDVLELNDCVANEITLMFEPIYKREILYAIYLSKNTNYYINTIRWTRVVLEKGYIDSASFIPREFNKVKNQIDKVLAENTSIHREVVNLLRIPGVGLKSIKAYLLHAYGLTQHAPIDRHYARFLDLTSINIDKKHCLNTELKCEHCQFKCPYSHTMKKFGLFNGVVQSLVYIHSRLVFSRKSRLEEILVKDPSKYTSRLVEVFKAINRNLTRIYNYGIIGEST